jgi:hypothetical protein
MECSTGLVPHTSQGVAPIDAHLPTYLAPLLTQFSSRLSGKPLEDRSEGEAQPTSFLDYLYSELVGMVRLALLPLWRCVTRGVVRLNCRTLILIGWWSSKGSVQ